MPLRDHGNGLISKDLKRLKKLNSLVKDLDVYFIAHKNRIKEFGQLSCIKVQSKNKEGIRFWLCKERIKITSPKTSESNGCRLWFLVLFNNRQTVYIRLLLYRAKEEPKYPKQVCMRLCKERLKEIGVGIV